MNADERSPEAASSRPAAGNDHAGLACDRCKRRKIKCDRSLPACRACVKTSRNCSYPLTSNKPGPKPGAPQRRKRQHLGQSASTFQTRSDFEPTPNSFVGNSSTVTEPSLRYDSGVTHPQASPRYERADAAIRHPESYERNLLPNLSEFSESRMGTPGSRGLALSQLIHPSHDPLPNSTARAEEGENIDERSRNAMISSACNALQISSEMYQVLLDAYFENMTAFSLFHRPTFDSKLCRISSPIQLQALLASMFSFSVRFESDRLGGFNVPPQGRLRQLAEQLVDQALKECSDDAPPLCLLQALILVTFEQLIVAVRSQAWRSVGTCVRVAYEMQLHLIDQSPSSNKNNISVSSLAEESRRAWWAIWECDVFASTIRRLPTAINWESNETWLPIDDDIWFANAYTRSCPLNPDASLAWKYLEISGNKSSKAWFIVTNALMRSAHLLSYPQAYPANERSRNGVASEELAPPGLEVIANSLYCLTAALPAALAYQGEYLNFSTSRSGNSVQQDSAKHCIHVMTQLSRFMINHYQVFKDSSRRLESTPLNQNPAIASAGYLDKAAWTIYLAAASKVVTIVRNSSPKHIQYANPFLANTIWLAAAAQVVSRCLGRSSDRRAADSNLDLLQLNLNAYVRFWGSSNSLQQKLITLETKLKNSKDQGRSVGQAREEHSNLEGLNSGGNGAPREDQVNQQLQNRPQASNLQCTTPSSMNFNEIVPSGGWGTQSGFDSMMGTDINSGLWGWGLDELLAYGGFE